MQSFSKWFKHNHKSNLIIINYLKIKILTSTLHIMLDVNENISHDEMYNTLKINLIDTEIKK